MQLITRLGVLLALFFLTFASYANSINLHDEPKDTAKIIGSIDLSAGIIPIYTPQNSQWIKVADPRNGNTGWVKNSELKDSKGNVITFSQQISDSGNGQSIQVMQTSGTPLTREQKQKLAAQLQQQEQTAKETLMKAQKSVAEVMEGLKKMYQQQLQIMEQSGFPVLMPSGAGSRQQGNTGSQPMMRQQPGMNQMQQQMNMPSGMQQPQLHPQDMQQGQSVQGEQQQVNKPTASY